MSPTLIAEGVSKHYGSTAALRSVDLEVDHGELVGLLGPNGAGKSTLTKIFCGLVSSDAGHIEVGGAAAGTRQARSAIGYLAELFRFPDWASADEVLKLHQQLARSGGGAAERERLLHLVGLDAVAERRVSDMSKGMQQRLGVAQSLVGDPGIVLLDEPTSALDPAGRRVVRQLLLDLREAGMAVLLSSHLLSEVELVCDRVLILSEGEVVRSGVPHELTVGRGVNVETATGVRRFESAGREDVPKIVAELVAAGEQIYDVSVDRPTLEDVYLEVVGDSEE